LLFKYFKFKCEQEDVSCIVPTTVFLEFNVIRNY